MAIPTSHRSVQQTGLATGIGRWACRAALAAMCLPAFAAPGPNNPEALLFRLDFEEAEIISPRQQNKYDILRVTLPSNRTGEIAIQYEGGRPADRLARVAPDPVNSQNEVLQFWLKNARIPGARKGYYKGRVQMNLAEVNKTEIYERHRMYLHPDLRLYRSYPGENKWFSIATMWIGRPADPHPFMISLDLVKPKGAGSPLYFMVSGDKRVGGRQGHGKWQTIWGRVNTDFPVPIGEWLDVEVGYKQGNGKSGRYYLGVKRQSDASVQAIFDVTDWTYSPEAPSPIALTNWNPLKLYTSGAIVDHIRSGGGVAQIYWDDLRIWNRWPG